MKSEGPMVALDFTPLTLTDWRTYFARVPRSTITQSYDYARAVAYASALRPRHALIRVGQGVVGLVQFMEVRAFGGALHVVALDRGPLWFDQTPDPAVMRGFLDALQHHYARRFGRMRRIILECPQGSMDKETLHATGLKMRAHLPPYQTDWMDLTQNVDQMRAHLDRKWRNILTRVERDAQVCVGFYTSPRDAIDVIAKMIQSQKERGYRGLDAKTLMRLMQCAADGDGVLIARATIDDVVVAGSIFIRHGSCATWQCGFVEQSGRDSAANYIMLWQSVLRLKDAGVGALDLGGMNDQDAQSIGHFKKGLGGEHVTLLGTFY